MIRLHTLVPLLFVVFPVCFGAPLVAAGSVDWIEIDCNRIVF
jgi:hypothetical protein